MRHRHQTQPSRWSCLPTSLAIVLAVPVKVIFELLGHDGSEILWPELPEPQCRRAFTLGEMVYAAEKFNRKMVVHQPEWVHSPDGKIITTIQPPAGYWQDVLGKYEGVITGETIPGRKRHAVAWVEDHVIDPTNAMELPYFHGKEEYFLACCQ